MTNNKQSSVEWLDRVYNKNGYILQDTFEQAKAMQQEQAQLYANYVVVSIEQGLPPITFNDWINLDNK